MHDLSLTERAVKASQEGNIEALEAIDVGVRGWGDIKDEHGATVVHYAARGGSVAALEWLVSRQGCDGHARSRVGATPAMDAAAAGALPALQWLLEKAGCSVKDTDDSGVSATHLSAR